jgi:hypothetical protein
MKKIQLFIISSCCLFIGCGTNCSKSTSDYQEGYNNGQIASTASPLPTCSEWIDQMKEQGITLTYTDCFEEGYKDGISGKKSQYPQEAQEAATTTASTLTTAEILSQPSPPVVSNTEQQQQPVAKDTIHTSIKQNVDSSANNNIAVVISERAYFYKAPDTLTKRKAYMVKGEQTKYIQNQGDFIYVIFTNPQGVQTTGYMLKDNFNLNHK